MIDATSTHGSLFLIGGRAQKCLEQFAELAGGASAHVVVLSHASSIPRQVGNEIRDALLALGVGRVTVLTPRSRLNLPDDITAVFMTGGDQLRLVRAFKRRGLDQQLLTAWRRGVLIAGGTSAGAAAVAPCMVAGGMGDGVLREGALILADGLGLLPGVIVDTHFKERNRENRMRAALACLPDTVALGLDEDTAVLVSRSRRCLVYGEGQAWVFHRAKRRSFRSWIDIARSVIVKRYAAGKEFRL